MTKSILVFGAFALASSSHAQLLLESKSFSAVGSNGAAVQGHMEFWKASSSASSKVGTFKLFIDNLSVYQKLDHTLTGHADGVLTGFGFNVGSGFSFQSGSFSESITGPLAGLETGPESGGILFSPQNSFTVGSGSSAETFEEGAFASTSAKGLAGGYAALFPFNFVTSSSTCLTSHFNSQSFFSDADLKDLYFRFQSVRDGDCDPTLTDTMFVGFPTNPPATPEPATYGLIGGVMLFGLVAQRRLRAKA